MLFIFNKCLISCAPYPCCTSFVLGYPSQFPIYRFSCIFVIWRCSLVSIRYSLLSLLSALASRFCVFASLRYVFAVPSHSVQCVVQLLGFIICFVVFPLFSVPCPFFLFTIRVSSVIVLFPTVFSYMCMVLFICPLIYGVLVYVYACVFICYAFRFSVIVYMVSLLWTRLVLVLPLSPRARLSFSCYRSSLFVW